MITIYREFTENVRTEKAELLLYEHLLIQSNDFFTLNGAFTAFATTTIPFSETHLCAKCGAVKLTWLLASFITKNNINLKVFT